MAKYVVKVEIEANEPTQVQELGNLIQHAVSNIDRKDLVTLLSKVKGNPGIVKTALKFI